MPILPSYTYYDPSSVTLDVYGVTFGGTTSTAGYLLSQPQQVSAGDAFLVKSGNTHANKLSTLSANGSNFFLTDTVPTYAISGTTGTGTVTSVTAGTGISISGSSSVAPTINVNIGTTAGTVCAGNDSRLASTGGGTGTVTSITAGTGLTGGTITTSGTIGLDADLAAIAALTATQGVLCKTAADTWALSKHPFNIGFYYEAALATTDKQPIWVAPSPCVITGIMWYIDNNLSPRTDAILYLWRNSSEILFGITIAGLLPSKTKNQYSLSPLTTAIAEGDVITATVSSAGSGIQNLSLVVSMTRVV